MKALFGELQALWPRVADLPLPRHAVAILHDYGEAVRYEATLLEVYAAFARRNALIDANSTWPLRRTLYAVCTGQTRTPQGTGIADRLCAPTAPGTRILHAAPLFQGSYLAP